MAGDDLADGVIPLVAGAALGLANDALVRRLLPSYRVPAAAAGLATAALIYPLARPRGTGSMETRAREWRAVAATVGIGVVASRLPDRAGRTLAAAGWAAHVAFDYLHDRGPTSRLPRWYPAVCAGYDLSVAGMLLTTRS